MGVRLALVAVLLGILCLCSCGGGSGSVQMLPTPTPPPGDFQLLVNSPSLSIQEGGMGLFEGIEANPINGFTGTISLSISGLPAGVTNLGSGPLSIPVTGPNAPSVTLELAAAETSPLGTTTVTVTGTSGAITHTVTFSLAITQAAPFVIQSSASSLSLTPASQVQAQISVTANPGTSPQLFLSVLDLPNNSEVRVGIPPFAVTPTSPQPVTVTATILAQPIQNFPMQIIASDSANNSSLVTIPLTVSVPSSSNTPTRSTFFRTDVSPTGMVYDQARKLVFVSVEILNEVEVLSSVDGHEVASIPVNFPAGIDEAADGSAVYVASQLVGDITTIDPNLLQVVGRSSVPSSVSGLSGPVSLFEVAALSNGKVLLCPSSIDNTKPPFYLWDPTTNTFSQFGPASLSPYASLIWRSADHSKVLSSGGVFSGGFVYDVGSNSFSAPNTEIGVFTGLSPDGSQIATTSLVQNSFFEVVIFDSNFNQLAGIPLDELGPAVDEIRPVYSRDGTRLYLVPDGGIGSVLTPVAAVVDTATFSVVGVVPTFSFGATLPFSGEWITTYDLDETGMLFGATDQGVGFLDLSSPTFLTEPLPGSFTVLPSLASVSSSTQAQLDGVGFSSGTLGFFVGAPPASPQTLAATNISTQSQNFVNLSIPAGKTPGPANGTLTGSDGFFEVMPDAVTFGPTILRVDADGGSPAGGDAITITGYGLGQQNTQVSIGGAPATITQQVGTIVGEPLPLNKIQLKTPAGSAGMADVTVTTASGSTTIAGGFEYLNSVQVFPVAGLLDALVYDQSRQRLYTTNQNNNRVEVFDLGSRSYLAPIPVGNTPTALAISPDSSLLAVVNEASGSISVVDLATMQVTATYSALTAADAGAGCGGVVLNITPAEPHRAMVGIGCTALLDNGVLHLINLDNGSLSCTGVVGCSSNGTDIPFGGFGLAALASTPDGSKILLAASSGAGNTLPVGILDLVANTLTTVPAGDFSDAAMSADGTLFAANFLVFNAQPQLLGFMAYEPYVDVQNVSFHNVFGEKMNPSGSLLFYPQDSGVDIFDTHSGRLVRHVALPDPIPFNSGAMALDETGTKMFLTSSTGITIAELFQAPLSIGTVNPASGPQGTTVVVRGSGFASGATVTFGTTAASTTFVDSNTLQATVPSLSAGPVRVSVTNPGGHEYSIDAAFVVN